MKILSWNVNGLRAVYKNGFIEWLKKENADIVCLQEIKVQEDQLPEELLNPLGYYSYFNSASKKGYSGVAVYTKQKPDNVEKFLGHERFDQEGRLLKLDFPEFSLINIYVPHGGREKENLGYKLEVYEKLFDYVKPTLDKKTIFIGDFNIAHKEIDLARPKQNLDNIMFTPEERRQVDKLVEMGFTDSFREFHKEGGKYSWLSYLPSAREFNIGWRIDCAFVSPELRSSLLDGDIYMEVGGSDHCPIGLELNLGIKGANF